MLTTVQLKPRHLKKNLSQSLLKDRLNAAVAAGTDVHQQIAPAAENGKYQSLPLIESPSTS